jgi:hypothetical protein
MKIWCQLIRLATVLGCLMWGSLVFADGGTAKGQFIVDQKPTELAYAYAFKEPGFSDPKIEDFHVILSDVALTGKSLEDQFERSDMSKAGKLHCIEIVINANKQVISVMLRHPSFKMSTSSVSTEDIFEAKIFDGKTIEGRCYRKTPGTSFEDLPYIYDITFSVTAAAKSK